VRHLVGVQAQVLSGAELALRARGEMTRAAVDRARLQDRSIVLTWAMRGTLHLIAAEDHGWLRPVVIEPRIPHSNRRLRQMGVAADQAERAVGHIERMLEREGPLTRPQIGERLRRRRIPTEGQILPHLLWLATCSGRVCYGPDQGGDRCFVLVRDWIGDPGSRDREGALAELAIRYLAAHGPATPADLAFWAGLTMGEARRAWAATSDRLREVETFAGPGWDLRTRRVEAPRGPVRLLPSFDEYLLGWKDRTFIADRERWRAINPGAGWYHPAVVSDGRAMGTWRSERTKGGLEVRVSPFSAPAIRRPLTAEVADLGRFLGTRAELVLR
jgi:hypothetical protein